MKKGNNITDFSSETIGERLERLRKEKGYVVINGKETKLTQEVISMDILQLSSDRHYRDYINGKTPIPVDRLCTLANLYNVSVDYLLCRIHYKHVGTNEIMDITGLTEDSIENIKYIRETCNKNDLEDISIYLISNGILKRVPQQRINTLNKLLSSEWFIHILYAFHNLIHSEYAIPVHFNPSSPGSPGGWVANDTPLDRTNYIDDKGNIVDTERFMFLSKSVNNPSDNIPITIDKAFLENIEMENIKTYLRNIKGCP